MDISRYFSENDGAVSFTEEQASAFAKGIAGDFNPIHNTRRANVSACLATSCFQCCCIATAPRERPAFNSPECSMAIRVC